jgi:hypothetical protein
MTRVRLRFSTVAFGCVVATFAVPVLPATATTLAKSVVATSCNDSWKSGVSGDWSASANWTAGVPAGNSDVCITVPGTYTVTLAPWSVGTADPNHNGDAVNSLTLGAASGAGTQTLDIAGQGSQSDSNEQVSSVFLQVAATSVITAHGRLVLDSTDGGSTLKGFPSGGEAALVGANILNYGRINTEVQDSRNKNANFTQIEAPLTNEKRASIHDNSGQLQATAVTNDGTFTVAPRASLSVVALQGSYGSSASFTNNGHLTNDGTVTADQGAGPTTWDQAGGPIKGHEIVLGSGTTLVDKSGAGRFLVNAISAQLRGTIPAGQTITVVGEAYNSNGDNYNGTTLGLGNTTVTNDGTLVLDAQGSGKTSGGPAVVGGGTINNNGTILAEVQDPVWTVQLQAGLENRHKGSLSLTGGTLTDNGGAVTNNGTVTLGLATTFVLQEGATFANESDGTIVTDIANAKSLGQFVLTGPCCAGPGKFAAGGNLLPEVVGGHTPAAGTDFQVVLLSGGAFSGTFEHLGNGFKADYAHESASPAFVGAIYRHNA